MIRRYHTVPITGEQTVGHHAYNVVQILRHITNDMLSTNLLKAALDHDVLEYFTGDIPHPTKKNFPDLALALDEVEEMLEFEMGIDYELEDVEVQLLRWADTLEAGIFGKYQMELGNRYGKHILGNVIIYFNSQAGMPQRLLKLVNELGDYYDGSQ